jgi:TfoX/Sxy family transcriptional regulator of competence genes
MAYNEKLANRIREVLSSRLKVEEKQMMGGLTFMVNKKMCVGIFQDDMMCRIHPDEYEGALERNGCRQMKFTGRPLKGFVFVDATGYTAKRDFDFWINLCLDFNKVAKASKGSMKPETKRQVKKKK